MKKKEIYIVIIFLAVVLTIAGLIYFNNKNKELGPEDYIGYVSYRDQILFEFDIDKDDEYRFNGSYGTLFLEVKDNKWRITREECPNHVCSSMGWVSLENMILPITCLPNEVIVYVQER